MKDSQEQATVMFKLTQTEASILLRALRTTDAPMPFDCDKPLVKRLEKDFKTMRAINRAETEGWYESSPPSSWK
jgi:hypothetical protein|tara:strand:+ start:751 stop:972 length:222 start_codon:yes stop_codon:yes gene_type:complete